MPGTDSGIRNDIDCVQSECLDVVAHVTMYLKLSSIVHLDCTPLLLFDDVWVFLVKQGKLSNCWVECPSGKMVKFGGRPRFERLAMNYASLMGFETSFRHLRVLVLSTSSRESLGVQGRVVSNSYVRSRRNSCTTLPWDS